MRVDVHTHVVPADLPDFAASLGDARWPVFAADGDVGRLWVDGVAVRAVPAEAWSMSRRLAHMDAVGVDVHVLSPLPPLLVDWAPAGPAAQFCARVNDGIAGMVAEAPTRLVGLAMVPLQSTPDAIRELERAAANGFHGIQIGTSAGEHELDHPSVRDVFACAAHLGMAVFVHPVTLGASLSWTTRIAGLPLTFGLGMTTDTAIAAGALVLGGVTTALPGLRICLAHGGGTFLWALPRIRRVLGAGELGALDEGLRNVYVDSVVYDRGNLDYLLARLGDDRVLWGTDYPLPAAADQTADLLSELPPHSAAKVCGANAAALLGMTG